MSRGEGSGWEGGWAWETARRAPIAVTRGSLLPASSLRGSSSPGGQLPVPSPAATQLPPPSHGAQRGAPQPGLIPGTARSFPGAGGRDGGLGGASQGPGSCTIVDARGLVTSASAAPGARQLRGPSRSEAGEPRRSRPGDPLRRALGASDLRGGGGERARPDRLHAFSFSPGRARGRRAPDARLPREAQAKR